jgi:hypothetical protein
MSDFESTPYDGHHPTDDPGNDWRGASGPFGMIERLVSYGNWAGPGNRALVENGDYIAEQRRANPQYDEVSDPRLAGDPRYQPIDGIDAAAKTHDSGYSHHLGTANMFGWEGMRNVREDDRRLVADTQREMDENGSRYSDDAVSYSEGLRGFFGSRVMGMDAIDWAENKAGGAWDGISGFGDQARGWGSLEEAGQGIGEGVLGAGDWLGDTAGEGWQGVADAGSTIADLGVPGAIGALAGFGDTAIAGLGHVGGAAWDGVGSIGSGIAGGASQLYGWLTDN